MTALTESKPCERAEWLDGPALVDWLRLHGLENVKAFGGTVQAAITRWQRGARASVYSVDSLMVRLDLHLSEIPDDIWIDSSRTGQKIDEDQRAELIARLEAGEKVKRLAQEFRVSPSTVRFHRDRQRECTHNGP